MVLFLYTLNGNMTNMDGKTPPDKSDENTSPNLFFMINYNW